VLALGCGGGESGGNGSGSAGASSAGATAVNGGADSTGASSNGGGAGDTVQSNGGAADSGGALNAGGAVNAGGAETGGGVNAGGETSGAGGGHAGAGGAPGLDPKLPPGANFDLSGFTLQLPVASGSSVLQVTDLSMYSSEYFSTATDGAMSFWCPVTGATTMNSHYPRTELRENPVGGDWAISGTHALTASFKVTKAPKSKGLIIGQIHGNATDGTGEVLKLEWMSNNEIIASVEDNNSAVQSDKSMGTYALNDQMSYAIKLVNSQLTVSVTSAKGVTKTITSPYTASRWATDSYYFKFGDYVQLNTGTSADGGRVSFYSFAIKHGN